MRSEAQLRNSLHYLGYLGTSYAPRYSCSMTLSSMVVSRDFQEVSVLECILGGLHIGVEVESEPERARAKLAKSKIDALIIDCDLSGTSNFLKGLQDGTIRNAVPLIIVSGSGGRSHLESKGASFVFEKPISVEQAVQTLSAARNMILDERLRYHRATLDVPVSLNWPGKEPPACPSPEPQPGWHRSSSAEAPANHRQGKRELYFARDQDRLAVCRRSGVERQARQRGHPVPGSRSSHEAQPSTLAGTPVLRTLKPDLGRRTSEIPLVSS